MKYSWYLNVLMIIGLAPIIIVSGMFWIWYVNNSNVLILACFLCGLFTLSLTTVGIIISIYILIRSKGLRKPALIRTGILIANLPVLGFYLWFGLLLPDYVVLKEINNNEAQAEQLVVSGFGEPKHLDVLNENSSKTIWLHLDYDGPINISYQYEGKELSHQIFPRIGPGFGRRTSFHLAKD